MSLSFIIMLTPNREGARDAEKLGRSSAGRCSSSTQKAVARFPELQKQSKHSLVLI